MQLCGIWLANRHFVACLRNYAYVPTVHMAHTYVRMYVPILVCAAPMFYVYLLQIFFTSLRAYMHISTYVYARTSHQMLFHLLQNIYQVSVFCSSADAHHSLGRLAQVPNGLEMHPYECVSKEKTLLNSHTHALMLTHTHTHALILIRTRIMSFSQPDRGSKCPRNAPQFDCFRCHVQQDRQSVIPGH